MSTPPQQNGACQRIFSESDELRLLKSVLKITSADPSRQVPDLDSAAFSRINRSLGSKFTPSQIKRKILRLRGKYHNQARSKSRIRTPHDRRIFEIARGIWGKNQETQRRNLSNGSLNHEAGADGTSGEKEEVTPGEEEEGAGAGAGAGAGEREGEECVRRERAEVVSDLSAFPAIVSEFSRVFPEKFVWKDAMELLGERKLREMNDKWLELRVEEAKLMARRAQLVQEQSNILVEVMTSSLQEQNGAITL